MLLVKNDTVMPMGVCWTTRYKMCKGLWADMKEGGHYLSSEGFPLPSASVSHQCRELRDNNYRDDGNIVMYKVVACIVR